MGGIERLADLVDQALQVIQKQSRETDLMKKAESIRDGLDLAVSGDKHALSRVFAANGCERIGRLRLVIDTVRLEGPYRKDPRWLHLTSVCETIENILEEMGTFRNWRPSDDDAELMQREMVRELRRKQGEASDDEEAEARRLERATRLQGGQGDGSSDDNGINATRSDGLSEHAGSRGHTGRIVDDAGHPLGGFAPYGAAHPLYGRPPTEDETLPRDSIASSGVSQTGYADASQTGDADASQTGYADASRTGYTGSVASTVDGQLSTMRSGTVVEDDEDVEVTDPNASSAVPASERKLHVIQEARQS